MQPCGSDSCPYKTQDDTRWNFGSCGKTGKTGPEYNNRYFLRECECKSDSCPYKTQNDTRWNFGSCGKFGKTGPEDKYS